MVIRNKKYKFAVIATDVVIFTVMDGSLKVLLIKMKKKPYTGQWAIPGGLIKGDESLDAAAERHLLTKTGVRGVYLEQLAAFGEPKRDPFGRVVSVAYFALIPSDKHIIKTTKEYLDVSWFPVMKLPKLAYDHPSIIMVALQRLQAKLEYTNIVYSLLPREFTLSEMQEAYETILRKGLDKRNFRKKVLSLKLVRKTKGMRRGDAYRPAQLYRFIKRKPQIVEIL